MTLPVDDQRPPRLQSLWPVVLAGEAIFVLPFVLPRLFRPTLLSAWGISNTQLGIAMSIYGIVAMVAYGVGGPLADRFPPRRLMAGSLIATSLGGIVLLASPTPAILGGLYAYFGLTTILVFWSAMIRVTHLLGGDRLQGTAFGILDAGRGLFAAVLASLLAAVHAVVVGIDADQVVPSLIGISSLIVALCGVIVWRGLADVAGGDDFRPDRIDLRRLRGVIIRPGVWLNGVIVLCAYCGYKSIDYYGVLVSDVLRWSDVQASWLTTLTFWMRPPAALLAGYVADRWNRFTTLQLLFVACVAGNLLIASLGWVPLVVVALLTLTTTAAAVYGLRAVYFAIFDDLNVPGPVLGTAVGIVSMIGFLPDVFYGPASGYIIDSIPGVGGYRILFAVTASIAAIGLVATRSSASLQRR